MKKSKTDLKIFPKKIIIMSRESPYSLILFLSFPYLIAGPPVQTMVAEAIPVAGMAVLPGRSVVPTVESTAVMATMAMLLAAKKAKATGRTVFTTSVTETLALNASFLVLLKILTVNTLVSTLKSTTIFLLKPVVMMFQRPSPR